MTNLTNRQIKKMIAEGHYKYLILHYPEKNGKTFIVERSNPSNVIGTVRRTVLNDFNTQQICKPLVYYEFQDSETFNHDRERILKTDYSQQ